jgi:hypothetical protein
LSKNIFVDDKYPIRVFIQLEGECKGVYVTNKSINGFDVIELQNGTSDVAFSWSLTANRKNSTDEKGEITSKHVGVRFPNSPVSEEQVQNSQSNGDEDKSNSTKKEK